MNENGPCHCGRGLHNVGTKELLGNASGRVHRDGRKQRDLWVSAKENANASVSESVSEIDHVLLSVGVYVSASASQKVRANANARSENLGMVAMDESVSGRHDLRASDPRVQVHLPVSASGHENDYARPAHIKYLALQLKKIREYAYMMVVSSHCEHTEQIDTQA